MRSVCDSMFESMAYSSKVHYHTFWIKLGLMTAMYKKIHRHTFQSEKNIQLRFCETWRKYNETGFSSTNWLSVLRFLLLAHTHSHTRVVSLMRYHFVIYHAAQQDVYPPLMHQRQQQFCPCLRAPSRLQRASAVLHCSAMEEANAAASL